MSVDSTVALVRYIQGPRKLANYEVLQSAPTPAKHVDALLSLPTT